MKVQPTLYTRVRERQVLLKAWRVIKANAERSGNKQSRLDAQKFDENLPANIENIQRRLQKGAFKFAPALGVAVPKGNGKIGKRAIVIAPVGDRVVQRAILDVLYQHCPSADLRAVLQTPTSVGGVPGRGIGHALALIEGAEDGGAQFAIRSDIRNFFPSFPKPEVMTFLREQITDTAFVDLFERAISVELANRGALGADAELFPLGADGVAQGSPLSVLAGNIVLRNFDAELNQRDVICVRYIDDFLILAKNGKAAGKALEAGLAVLKSLNLEAYDPQTSPEKAWSGPISTGFDFLGYRIVKGLNPPSAQSRDKLLANVAAELAEGKKWIGRTLKEGLPQTKRIQCYIQTLTQIDGMLRGWAGAFQHSRSTQSFTDLDRRIDEQILSFESWFEQAIRGQPANFYRRALGVRLLSDSEPIDLPAVEA